MAIYVDAEERKEIKDEFIFDNQQAIGQYEIIINEYCDSKTKLSDLHIITSIFPNYEKIEDIAGNILFTLATLEPGAKPIQSIAGSVSAMMSASDSFEDRTDAMWIAMELLMVSAPFVAFSISRNGHPMIETMISDEDLITKNIVLPLTRPTDDHKQLGMFNWKLESAEALDKLNRLPMVILDMEETEPMMPSGNPYSDDYKKQMEKVRKYTVRKHLIGEYQGKNYLL